MPFLRKYLPCRYFCVRTEEEKKHQRYYKNRLCENGNHYQGYKANDHPGTCSREWLLLIASLPLFYPYLCLICLNFYNPFPLSFFLCYDLIAWAMLNMLGVPVGSRLVILRGINSDKI